MLAPTWYFINKDVDKINREYNKTSEIDYNALITEKQKELVKLQEKYNSSDGTLNEVDLNDMSKEIISKERTLNILIRDKQNASNMNRLNSIYSAYRYYNSAYSYLMLNDEKERADKLKKFIELLSNINTESPWYFSSVNGINEALDRKFVEEPKTDLSERKKLTITCLPDAFDNRISTLLELYRDVTWSWVNKREVIPSNLRKFDMAIYIFENPDMYWHTSESRYWKQLRDEWKDSLEGILGGAFKNGLFKDNESYPVIGYSPYGNIKGYKRYTTYNITGHSGYDYLIPSYKMIEFHDCEFSYNSIKTGISEISNDVGVSPKYTIDITYGDCYEMSYNDVLMREIGDVIQTDTYISLQNDKELISKSQEAIDSETSPQRDQLHHVMYPHEKNWAGKLGEALMSKLNEIGNSALKRAALGNLYSFSLTNLRDQISNAVKSPTSVITTVNDYAKSAKTGYEYMVNSNSGQFIRDENGKIITKNLYNLPIIGDAVLEYDKLTDTHHREWKTEEGEKSAFENETKNRSEDFTRTEGIKLSGHGDITEIYDDNIFKSGHKYNPEFDPSDTEAVKIGAQKRETGDLRDNNIFDVEGTSNTEAVKIGAQKRETGDLRDNNIFDVEGTSNTEAVKIGAQKRETGDLKNSNIFANYTKNKVLSKMGKNNLYK